LDTERRRDFRSSASDRSSLDCTLAISRMTCAAPLTFAVILSKAKNLDLKLGD
jgi:hypothetical protein